MPILFFLPLLLIHNLGKEDTDLTATNTPRKHTFFFQKLLYTSVQILLH